MANQKFKVEQYANLGGINQKISPYENTVLEFLNIINFDFQTPGALTERWGSTQYMGQTFPGAITGLFEFSRLSGASYVVVGHTAGIWAGATTGNSQGLSFTIQGVTNIISPSQAGQAGWQLYNINFQNNSGWGIVNGVYAGKYQGIAGNPIFGGANGITAFVNPNAQAGGIPNFITFVDRMFSCDGNGFWKYDGTTTFPVGLPPPAPVNTQAALANAGSTVFIGTATFGTLRFFASNVNNRGFESQIWPIVDFDLSDRGGNALVGSSLATTFIQAYVDVFTPPYFGVSAVNLYSYFAATTYNADPAINAWLPNYVFLGSFPAGSGGTTRLPLGSSTNGTTLMLSNLFPQPTNLNSAQYQIFGLTAFPAGAGVTINTISQINIAPTYPTMLEVYKDRLFSAGYTNAPSTVWFSQTTEPEGYLPANNFEVRTNDADILTAIKAFNTRIYFFKRNSFHGLQGDNPQNFFLQEVSLIYGCLNERCVVTFENQMAFLDRNGVMVFNGANIEKLSLNVQPLIDRMNYSSALTVACGTHDKTRNQIMFAIPIDSSTVNNLTLIYDYVTNAWTSYNGFIPSIFAQVQGRNTGKFTFYGTPSGAVSWFGPSIFDDNGSGFTCYFKTRFLHDLGDSVTKQFRRLYLDAALGITFVCPINFFQDYGTSMVYQTTLVTNQFQNRIDFGIPAKSLAFEFSNFQTNSVLQVYGFTLESRLQRKV